MFAHLQKQFCWSLTCPGWNLWFRQMSSNCIPLNLDLCSTFNLSWSMWSLNTWLSAVDQHWGEITTCAYVLAFTLWNSVPVWRQHHRVSGLSSTPNPHLPSSCNLKHQPTLQHTHSCARSCHCYVRGNTTEALISRSVSSPQISSQAAKCKPVGGPVGSRYILSRLCPVHHFEPD